MAESDDLDDQTIDIGGNNTVNIGALTEVLTVLSEQIQGLIDAQPKPPGPTDEERAVESTVAELNIAIERAHIKGSRVAITVNMQRSTTNDLVCPEVYVDGWHR